MRAAAVYILIAFVFARVETVSAGKPNKPYRPGKGRPDISETDCVSFLNDADNDPHDWMEDNSAEGIDVINNSGGAGRDINVTCNSGYYQIPGISATNFCQLAESEQVSICIPPNFMLVHSRSYELGEKKFGCIKLDDETTSKLNIEPYASCDTIAASTSIYFRLIMDGDAIVQALVIEYNGETYYVDVPDGDQQQLVVQDQLSDRDTTYWYLIRNKPFEFNIDSDPGGLIYTSDDTTIYKSDSSIPKNALALNFFMTNVTHAACQSQSDCRRIGNNNGDILRCRMSALTDTDVGACCIKGARCLGDQDCVNVDCGTHGECASITPDDGNYICLCACNCAGDHCEVDPFVEIRDEKVTSTTDDCDEVTISYTRHLNADISGSGPVAAVDDNPTYTLYYMTRLDYAMNRSDWMTQTFQETVSWTTNTDIPGTVTLSGLLDGRDYVAFLQYSLPAIHDNCDYSPTDPDIGSYRFNFATCRPAVPTRTSEFYKAMMTCRRSGIRHQFRTGCKCWKCLIKSFAVEIECDFQTPECIPTTTTTTTTPDPNS